MTKVRPSCSCVSQSSCMATVSPRSGITAPVKMRAAAKGGRGAGDRSNRNEAGWIESALRAGVSEHDLWFVVHPKAG